MATDGSSGIHVEMDGDGPPLLLLHGFTGGAATIWPLGRRLTDLRQVAAVDLPGHGRTGVPDAPQRFGFAGPVGPPPRRCSGSSTRWMPWHPCSTATGSGRPTWSATPWVDGWPWGWPSVTQGTWPL